MLAMAGGTDQEIDGLQASQSGVAIGGLPVPLFWDVPRRELPACDPMNRVSSAIVLQHPVHECFD